MHQQIFGLFGRSSGEVRFTEILATLRGRVIDSVRRLVIFPIRGVGKFFKTLAKLANSSELFLAKSGNNWPKI
jgi:hypothetical protein